MGNLSKDATQWLEVDSNLQPFGYKAQNMLHAATPPCPINVPFAIELSSVIGTLIRHFLYRRSLLEGHVAENRENDESREETGCTVDH